MTIKKQIDYIMTHPYYSVALSDRSAMERLLFEVMFSTYSTCASNASKVYRANRGLNTPDCVSAIKDMEPPLNLDVRLPFVKPEEVKECPVVELKVVYKPETIYVIPPKKVRLVHYNPSQLIFDFTIKPQPFLAEALQG